MKNVSGEARALVHNTGLSVAEDDFAYAQQEKISQITMHFRAIMETLGLDLTDDSLKNTPDRVARMYVTEIFEGLSRDSFPRISLFDNKSGYREMLLEREIDVYAYCAHHFLPFTGKAHVAYMPDSKIIGLSKINRIVKYFCRRPQLQEGLTTDIADCLKEILQTEDVAVMIEASHFCVASRGAADTHSVTVTSHFGGRFNDPLTKEAFFAGLHSKTRS